ncbi:hypothetical protein FA95DRAFT_1171878 [Auriscalpium vulgare]|uniref:Uncharacterized protein n=1 Tax=Auriscalpium vulgare TaxID=40419 RepID=A0ACB8S9Q0_9AGAM|nr:hypothetical protein FA95DRAFT_1171878 [Auriscalpium vulgare]
MAAHDRHLDLPPLGGKSAVILFAFTLVAFVAESQLTQYVQSNLAYRQPFFLFYIVHSSFSVLFPLHICFIAISTRTSVRSLFAGLIFAVKTQFVTAQRDVATIHHAPFPLFRFAKLIALLTIGATVPALLWFASVSLSPVSDLNAIWNTNAFFAYAITVKLFKLSWEPRKLAAVSLATAGVLAVIYGGSQARSHETTVAKDAKDSAENTVRAPLVGDMLTLCAAFGYGLYQVMYKRYAALPSDPEFESSDDAYMPISISTDDLLADAMADGAANDLGLSDVVYPPPFGLHPNFITSGIGLTTFGVLWIFIPVLHYTGGETFRLPPNSFTVLAIAGIATTGVIFNAGLMTLLGIWGPVIVSVGNLLTIVLVLVSDTIFGHAAEVLTIWSLTGSAGIILAFGILVYDMLQRR